MSLRARVDETTDSHLQFAAGVAIGCAVGILAGIEVGLESGVTARINLLEAQGVSREFPHQRPADDSELGE